MLNRLRVPIILLLGIITVAGLLVVCLRYNPGKPVEINLIDTPEFQGSVYIYGAVTNPGFYNLSGNDTMIGLIQAAGGVNDTGSPQEPELYIPYSSGEPQPQKIDINRAEAWLLKALPGIGETRAQAIITYREQHGLFKNIIELTHVEGIGSSIYEQIKDLITVNDSL